MSYRNVLALFAFVVLGLAVAPARADVIQLTSPAQLTPGGAITDYPGANNARFTAPLPVPVGGTTITFTAALLGPNNGLLRLNQGTGFFGSFPLGTELLVTESAFGTGTGPLTLDFSVPLIEFGLSAENIFSAFDATSTFTFQVFTNTVTRTFTVSGSDTAGPFFIGARRTASDAITRIVISGSSTLGSFAANDFAIGPVTVQAVPEPATMLLLGTGLAGVAGARLRKRQQSKTE